MSDNKNIQDGRDRSKVSGSEYYEVQFLAEKMNVTPQIVRDAIQEVGNDREKVEQAIKRRSAEK